MTEQEIQVRIEKKEKDIAKIEKRIKKWTDGMSEEAKKIVSACELRYEDPKYAEAYKQYKTFEQAHKDDPKVYRQDYDWNKGPNIDEARRAYIDLAEAKATLEKYKTQINKVSNFNNMEKIPAIWDFLQEWRKQAYEYFVKNVKLYSELRAKHDEEWEKFKNSEEYERRSIYFDRRFGDYGIRREWEERYYGPIHNITKMIYQYKGKWDDAKLNKILDQDVQNKYNDFVHRITEKAGVIQDATGLHIGPKGDINGVVIGDKNKVRVETITAGGYNQEVIVNVKHGQILHYRVLVNVIH